MAAADDPAATAASSSGPAPNRTPGSNRSKAAEAWAKETMETASACEIARLPEELISAAISRTAPRDACRAAAVSPVFLSAADSDAVWSCFLPRDLLPFAEGELHPMPQSKKALFMRLSDSPVLLADGLSMWLDRESGAKCYMLSARALCIIWGDTPRYWRCIPLTDSRSKSPLCLAPFFSCEF